VRRPHRPTARGGLHFGLDRAGIGDRKTTEAAQSGWYAIASAISGVLSAFSANAVDQAAGSTASRLLIEA